MTGNTTLVHTVCDKTKYDIENKKFTLKFYNETLSKYKVTYMKKHILVLSA